MYTYYSTVFLQEPPIDPPCEPPIFCPECKSQANNLDNLQIECLKCDKCFDVEDSDFSWDYFDEERSA